MAKKKRLDTLKLEDVVVDDEFQMRAGGLDDEHVQQMVETLKTKGGSLPRVRIIHVKGIGNILTDGFGRYAAHQTAGVKNIAVTIEDGSMLDAMIAAAGANIENLSMPRTRADKRRAVEQLLAKLLDAGEDWADSRVADAVGVSKDLVKSCRIHVEPEKKDEEIPIPMREGKDGKLYPSKKAKPSTGGSWEEMPLDEFLNVDPYVWDALKTLRITTAGDLHKRIVAGEKFGLTFIDVDDLKKQVETFKAGSAKADQTEKDKPKERPKEVGQEEGFNHREYDAAFGIVVRGIDHLASMTDPKSPERKQCLDHLTTFRKIWDAWNQRLKK